MSENEAPLESPTPKPSALVDLTDLRMMPAWVSGMSTSSTNLSQYEEREDRGPRRDGDRNRPQGDRRGGPPPRRDGPGGGPRRDSGDSRPPRRDGPPGQGGGPRRDGPPGQGGGPRRDRGDQRGGGPRRFGDRDAARPQREWVEIPRDIQVSIEPEDKSAEALANHIRSSGHAFSMFDAARLVLAGNDRFHARFTCAQERTSGLFVTLGDGGLFLSREEATQHILRSSALDAFYRTEEIELEEPKGDFKSVGVCGISGELLGPPSHHSFQTSIIRLHRERFSSMALEDFKRRVRIEANPELVTQWKEKQKKGQRWVWLKGEVAEGAEPVTLSTRAEMEAHFRRLHGEEAVKEAREAFVIGNIDKSKLSHVLFLLLRNAVDSARKHLFEISQKLGSSFERRGLKLFKRRAGKLFVCRVKPRAIDQGTVFSERVTKIVEVLKGKSGILLHDLVEAICPSEAPAPVAEGETAVPPPPTEEQITVIKDIRWLANEGYVIEYSDGMVFLGVQGEPQSAKAPATVKPEATVSEAEAPTVETEAPVAETEAPSADVEVPAAETEASVAESPAEEADAPTVEVVETTTEEVAASTAETEAAPDVDSSVPTAPAESSGNTLGDV